MKLYVCWGTFPRRPRPGGHPCQQRPRGAQAGPAGTRRCRRPTAGASLGDALNPTRKPVRELTGSNWVPVLVTDEDEVIQGSQQIVDWAKANPATASDAA